MPILLQSCWNSTTICLITHQIKSNWISITITYWTKFNTDTIKTHHYSQLLNEKQRIWYVNKMVTVSINRHTHRHSTSQRLHWLPMHPSGELLNLKVREVRCFDAILKINHRHVCIHFFSYTHHELRTSFFQILWMKCCNSNLN